MLLLRSVGESLADLSLYRGGDVSERQLLLLHELPNLPDSTKVVDGLYATSSVRELRDAIEQQGLTTEATVLEQAVGGAVGEGAGAGTAGEEGNAAPRSRVKCVAGFAGWAREQLDAELQRNVWFLAEADDVAALAFMEPSAGKPTGAEWLRDAMWSGALAQLGGEHAALACFPGDHEVVWELMEELWTRQSEELHRRIDMLDPRGPKGEVDGPD